MNYRDNLNNKMNKLEYKEYLASLKWLLKKNQVINIYLSQGWAINCNICKSTQNLNLHHDDYKQIGNENLEDDGSGDIFNLRFLCKDCHYKWHFDKNFRAKQEKLTEEAAQEFFNSLLQKQESNKRISKTSPKRAI